MEITLDILGHADSMGRLRKTKEAPGLPAFSGTVESVRGLNHKGTLLLDSGDEWNVNFWGGIPVVKALNLMRTDVFTLGNHEFDWGKDFLEECIASCEFPVLCANIHYKETGQPIAGTIPYTILERQGVKIGVLGITTEYTPYMVEKSAFLPFEVSSAIEAGNRYIPKMRAEGAEVMVLLAHCPFYVEDDGLISGELWEILEGIPPVDVAIGGHIPGDYARVINDTCILKAGFSKASLGHARLVFDTEIRRVISRTCQILETDPDQEGIAALATHAAEAIAPFEEYLEKVLAQSNSSWSLTLAKESKLGDFLADCLRSGGSTQLAYMNATSAGGTIEKGPVTRENIIEVCRFNDPICVGEITGELLYQLIELVYKPHRFGNNAGILISGFHANLDHTKPSPHKVISLTLPDGTPIDRQESYTVTTSSYMASGGNDTSLVAKQIDFKKLDATFHDVAFAYAKAQGILTVEDYPRVTEKGTPENDNSPF